MDTVRVGRDTRLEEDKKRNEPCFRCNKSGHTTEECEAYSSFNKRSGYTFERAIPRDLLRQDYVVPGPGSYDVDVSSFKLLNDQNRKRNSPDESKRRSSDSHIVRYIYSFFFLMRDSISLTHLLLLLMDLHTFTHSDS